MSKYLPYSIGSVVRDSNGEEWFWIQGPNELGWHSDSGYTISSRALRERGFEVVHDPAGVKTRKDKIAELAREIFVNNAFRGMPCEDSFICAQVFIDYRDEWLKKQEEGEEGERFTEQ